jgi:hypothetical protein
LNFFRSNEKANENLFPSPGGEGDGGEVARKQKRPFPVSHDPISNRNKSNNIETDALSRLSAFISQV